jgi:hypothetical protein
LRTGEDVYAFAAAVAPYVASIHLYNTRLTGADAGRHFAPAADQRPDEGWMDLDRLLHVLLRSGSVKRIIFEYHPTECEVETAQASLRWLRGALGRIGACESR